MYSISSVLAKYSKIPGDIKIKRKDWDDNRWFQPFFAEGLHWHGRDEKGERAVWSVGNVDWDVYQPTIIVKRALYAFRGINGWTNSKRFFKDDREAVGVLGTTARRLPWSEVEFPN